MNPPKNAKWVRAFLEFVGYYHKFLKKFAHIAKLLMALTYHDVKFVLTSTHLTTFNTLKSALLEAPVLHYPDPSKHYIVYTYASDDDCWVQLPQEHDDQDLPVSFLLHTFMDTWWKQSTAKEEAYGVYYAVTMWNILYTGIWHYCPQWPQASTKIMNVKNANDKVNRWSLGLATYNIKFEWTSGACNKAADCLLQLVNVKDTPATPTAFINMLDTSTSDSPATCTHSKTCKTANTTSTDTTPTLTNNKVNAPPTLPAD